VIEVEPANAQAHQYLGFTWLRLKEVDKAIANYETAAKLDPDNWEVKKGLGVSYILKSVATKDDTFKEKGLAQWAESLRIEPDQTGLRELYERYTNQ